VRAFNQLPVQDRPTQDQPQSGSIRRTNALKSDGLFARYRRLELRLAHLENVVSALRRDCNRIEKSQSRAKALTPVVRKASPDLPAGSKIPPEIEGLFGGKI
jgi:hypothetical protein